MSEWISVKDRLPDCLGEYLIWLNGECDLALRMLRDGDPSWDSWYIECLTDRKEPINITHWMPLPTPPKEQA